MGEIFVPRGRAPKGAGKNRDGLYIGAVVVIQNTGYGIVRDGVEQPVAALVSGVYPDDATGTDRFGTQQPWLGDRPFIDAIAVVEQIEGVREVVAITKVPWATDVARQMQRQGIPETVAWIGYRIVTRLEGIR